jgi:aminomethyltransferase
MADTSELLKTPLYALHVALGAKFGPFAGYDMPIQYLEGIRAEHLWTRAHAALFDVSHMGPGTFRFKPGMGPADPDASFAELAHRVERVLPSNVQELAPGRLRYTVLLNDAGGIDDDLFVGRPSAPGRTGDLYFVVNAGTKDADFTRLAQVLGEDVALDRHDRDAALIALQGPEAVGVLSALIPGVEAMVFMDFAAFSYGTGQVVISRSGYTGEDGFEILVWNDQAEGLARALLADPRVKPVGLGARDSLRLEAGLCLYGHDMDASRTPVEASLQWVMQKRRREAGDFVGAERILSALKNGPAQRRVGLRLLDKAPAREGTELALESGEVIGVVTSGGFSLSDGDQPISMGYVRADLAATGTRLDALIRGKPRPAVIADLPFVATNYYRG